ncbi:ClbS/DfsB family four-helix bundle protein [Chromobacterium sp. IIBBL 290-4]|nr:ClbS/DfsB family four-helix bundle protein [Chromobacterium sp. IIBBL 290-4]UTH74531.1 ClbS/DfsB family four-helix bundle protein [Chromobacterium sp. IIBBL 290-4]
MAVPQSKDELLGAMRSSYASLRKALERVPEERLFEPSLEGHAKGTLMSVADLLAYLIGWNALVLKWHERESAGLAIDFPETGYAWNQLGLLAGKFYRDYRGLSAKELSTRLDDGFQALARLVEGLSDAELYGACWYGKWTRGRMIQFNSASPYRNARGRIVGWLRRGPA